MRLRTTPGQHPDKVAETCARVARRWAGQPRVVTLVRALLDPYSPVERDEAGRWVPDAIWAWARTLTHWREPGPHGEVIQALPWTVVLGGGDCDDVATAQATIAHTVGLPTWIARIWTGPSYAHVVCVVGDNWAAPGARLNLDPSQELGPGRWLSTGARLVRV